MVVPPSPQQFRTSDVTALVKAAAEHHQAGRLAEAERWYIDTLSVEPDHFHALRLLGALNLQMQRYDAAEPLLQRALIQAPENIELLNNLGIALRQQRKLEEAAACYERILLKNSYNTDALINFADILCEFGKSEESIPFYERAFHLHSDRADVAKKLGSILWMLNRMDEAGVFFEKAVTLHPDDVESFVNLGMTLHLREKFEDAVKCYEKALSIRPDYAEAHVNLGAAFLRMHKPDDAIQCYNRALSFKPDFVHALVELGSALDCQGHQNEARTKYERALHLEPDNPSALSNLGVLWHAEGQPGKALEFYDKALRANARHVHARVEKAFALLALGRYAEGWAFHEAGLGSMHWRGPYRFGSKMWDGAVARNKRLLVWCEQGYGDSIQFIRYAALCKERVDKVYVQCPKPLLRLFKDCPYIDDAFETVNTDQFDEQIAMMSLPHVFGTTMDTIPTDVPYLFVRPEVEKKWANKFADLKEFKVGLVWASGSPAGKIYADLLNKRRSIGLELMKPLFGVPNIRLYSLQVGPEISQIGECGLQDRLIDYTNEIEDFMDTAAIIQNLDLIISIDTSVAHLAGALGKPVWVLSRFDADWRWLRNQETNPWYPTARVFGQLVPGDWGSVIAKVADALPEAYMNSRHYREP